MLRSENKLLKTLLGISKEIERDLTESIEEAKKFVEELKSKGI